MSKQLFEMMRLQEVSSLYPTDFTKKEAQQTGKDLVNQVLELGNVSTLDFGANLVRLSEVIGSAMAELRIKIKDIEKQTVQGVEFNPVNGGETLNFKDDEIWSDIKRELSEREEVLKVAYKSKGEIYDEGGVLVPKVSSTPRASSITIKF
jgi:hypothetical protein